MSDREIILSQASDEMIPETLSASDYYAGNDPWVQDERQVDKEIAALIDQVDPKVAQMAQMRANGANNKEIAKHFKCSDETVSKYLTKPLAQKLVHYIVHKAIHRQEPAERLLLARLERIAIDNEKTDPNAAIKAIRAIHDILHAKASRATGGFKIVINGAELQKGALDE